MRGMLMRMPRRLTARTQAGIAVMAMALSVLAACATGGKVEVPAAKVEVPVAKEPSAVKGPSVAGLADGREGFIITEVPTMDEASRRDFDRAVAMLEGQDYARAIELLEKVIERSPGVTAPYIDIAIAYQLLGQPKLAEERLQTALTLFPGHPVACNEYGLLYRK